MARKKLILSPDCVYHVLNRSNNKEFFYIPIHEAWAIFCEVLSLSSVLYKTEIYSFVLMSNHYHLIVAAPSRNLHLFMRHFQTETTRRIQKQSGRINHVFGTRYKWSCLWTSAAYALAYKYVLRNPVKAEICTQVDAYPYSSLTLDLPIADRIGGLAVQVPQDHATRLEWLNKPTQKKTDEVIRRALRRKEFSIPEGNDMRYAAKGISSEYGVELDAPGVFAAGKGMGTFRE